MNREFFKVLSDEEIIKIIKSDNNSHYFEIIYNKYYSKVLDKCFGLLKNKQKAEEFTEDIFSKTFEKLTTFRHKSTFSSWLYSVTYNHCIDYLRKKKKMHYPDWNRDNEISEIIEETDENLNEINYENLLLVLELIHPEEKTLLIMKYLDNLSLKQIGESLRISEDATKMRLKRARARVFYLYKNKYLNK